MALCPNKQLPEWELLVNNLGEQEAYRVFIANGEEVPDIATTEMVVEEYLKQDQVLFNLKVVEALSSLSRNKFDILKQQGWINDLKKKGISEQQLDMFKEVAKDDMTKDEIIVDLISTFGFNIEIKTSIVPPTYNENYEYILVESQQEVEALKSEGWTFLGYDDESGMVRMSRLKGESIEGTFTTFYKKLTVPGGINYRELEISTPKITPSIKGHADFATNQGIGWARIDESNSNVRRVLEVQSDLFQKGRDKNYLTDTVGLENELELVQQWAEENQPSQEEYDAEIEKVHIRNTNINQNKFLQLLNKNGNWVRFFIQSIVQDSTKKGYKKVRFPAGETAAKIEGHETLAREIQQIDKELTSLETYKETNNAKIKLSGGAEWVAKRGNKVRAFFTKEEADKFNEEKRKDLEKKKQELKSQGIEKLKPIEGFYEVRVQNTLKKIYGKKNVERVTDEFGNDWFQVNSTKVITPKTIGDGATLTRVDIISLSIEAQENSIVLESEVHVPLENELNPVLSDARTSLRNSKFRAIRAKSKAEQIARTIKNEDERKSNTAKAFKLTEKIEQIDEDIKTIETEQSTRTLLEIANRTLEDVERILNGEFIDETDLVNVDKELAVWMDFVDLIQLKSDDNLMYVENEAIHKEASRISGEAVRLKNVWLDKTTFYLLDQSKNKLIQELTAEDLKVMKETGLMKSLFLDLSHNQNKLAQLIDLWLRDANQAAVTEYESRVALPMREMVDYMKSTEDGESIDVFSKKFQEKFIQKDPEGNLTYNQVNPFSQAYYNFRSKIAGKFKFASELEDRTTATNIYKAGAKELSENVYVVDSNILFERKLNKETWEYEDLVFEDNKRNSEYLRMRRELGENEYIREVNRAGKRMEKYYLDFNEVKDGLSLEFTGEELNREIEEWVDRYNPFRTVDQLKGKKADTSGRVAYRKTEGYQYLVQVPRRKTTKGVVTEWYDKDYMDIRDNKKLSKFYDWYTDMMKQMMKELPSYRTENLQSNYLPEVTKSLFEVMFADGANLSTIKNTMMEKLIESISVTEEDTTIRQERDKFGNPIPSIPVRFINDTKKILSKKALAIGNEIDKQNQAISTAKANGENTELLVQEVNKLSLEHKQVEDELQKTVNATSTDLVGILQVFGMMALNFKHKSIVEDVVILGKKMMDEALQIQLNVGGQELNDIDGKLVHIKNGLIRTKAATDNAINSLLYGQHRNEKASTGINRHTDSKDRKRAKEIRKELRQLHLDFYRGNLEETDYSKKQRELEEEMAELKSKKVVVSDKLIDFVNNITQLKGVGFNYIGATVNLTYGILSNLVHAAGGADFNTNQLMSAYKIMLSTTRRAIGFGQTDQNRKIKSLMNKFNVLFDVNEAAYGNKRAMDEKWKRFGLIVPFESQRRAEYFAQGSIMTATLLNTFIEVDGQKISLWDAHDSNGNIRSDLNISEAELESWSGAITGKEANKFSRLRNKIAGINQEIHGNYNPNSPILIKSFTIGRLLMVFKSWMPEGIAQRIGDTRFSELSGRKHKPRYKTYAEIGAYNSLRLLWNLTKVGKGLGGKINVEEVVTPEDLQNLRRNLAEMQFAVSLMIMAVLTKMGLDNLDDDDDKFALGVGRITLNILGRLEGDLTFYMTPTGMTEMLKSPVPAIKTLNDFISMPKAVYNYLDFQLMDGDERYDEGYLAQKLMKPFPVLSEAPRLVNMATKIY